ncbi:MAG TPA: transcription antitermination factor NusB [Spirochaetales bacterium]|nr:transcription antitermination factor NusB [Spirochaetales bacterium]HOV37246.1 transcription antitermination factor NusB [Spirochaetales bacterium]
MGPRRRGRILAVQALYSYEIRGGVDTDELIRFSWEEKEGDTEQIARDFASLLVIGTIENLAEIDRVIQGHLEHWELKRVSKVDLSILRMSVYCLLFQKEMPSSVVIDEAVDISKELGAEDTYRFVNGVLDSIRKSIDQNEL